MPGAEADLWRDRSLSIVLKAGTAIAIVALAISIPYYLRLGHYRIVIGNLAVGAVAVALQLARRRISYAVRAAFVVACVYAAGLNLTTSVGFMSSGPIWIFAGTVFTAVFLGRRLAVISVAVNTACLALLGYLIQTGRFGPAILPFVTDRQAVITIVTFSLLNAVTGVALSGMVAGLASLAQRNRDALEDLRRQQGRLVAAREELQQEIHERIEAERALRESEARYRLLVESTSDGFFVVEAASGRFLFLNQRICDLFGYSAEEGLGVSLWDVVAEEDHALVKERLRARSPSERNTYTARRKDGSTFRAEVSVSLTGGETPTVQGMLRDVTPFERLQEVQRFESIGTLAGGLAHNFNNLLMGIQGNVSVALLDLAPGHPHFELLQGIEAQVRHGAAITRQMLGFARGGQFEVKTIDLNVVLRQCAEMLGQTRKDITIQLVCAPDLFMVEADRGQLEQVLLNLFVNAQQAMPGGGELRLRTENVTLDAKVAAADHVAEGKYAKVSVEDTGVGMDERVMRRIFEPFFTTKEVGQGTGLGLASAYGIVRNHRGVIKVTSEVGRGSTFDILLPASETAAVSASAGAASQDVAPRGRETIVLVDDEELVLNATRRLLSSLGYTVLCARSGAEALAIVEREGARVDLLLSDLAMPQMTGTALFDRVRTLAPRIRVLFSSGYNPEDRFAAVAARADVGFIQKPFDRNALARKLREVLDAPLAVHAPE